VFLSLALAFCVVGAAASVSPRRLVIQKSDLSTKFRLTSSKNLTNASVIKQGSASAAQLARWGRAAGYQVMYSLNTSKATVADLRGVLVVQSTASVYASSSGAHAAWLRSIAALQKNLPGNQQPVRARLGNESASYSYTSKSNGYAYTDFVFSWRSSSFTEGLICAGLRGKITPSMALALVHKQLGRAGAAG
jgi:hypothetical protein